jgi:hydroxysqualene dehydroxylase
LKVVVVGGGFAGLAAAISLQERRHEVTLLERRGILGGRATSFDDAQSGEAVDNGTHLMIAGYRDTLDLVRRAGAEDLLLVQDRLHIEYVDDEGRSALDCPPLTAPLHLLAGIFGLRLPWRVKLGAVRFGLAARYGRTPQGLTLAEWLARTGQGPEARRLLWDPLATAILNETPERAAATLFHRVFQEAFLKDHLAARLVFLRAGYAALHERLARYLEARGGHVRRRALADEILIDDGRVNGVRLVQRAATREEMRRGKKEVSETVAAEAVISAVTWSALPALLPEALRSTPPFDAIARLTASPIVSIELWLDRPVVETVMVGLRDSEVEWVFDKGRLYGRDGAPQHLAFIVSAAHRSAPRKNAELVSLAEAALRRYFPAMKEAAVVRSLVVREPEATFSSDPAAEELRPGPRTFVKGFYLAGDWTRTGLPATIEGAVRSGLAAALEVERG